MKSGWLLIAAFLATACSAGDDGPDPGAGGTFGGHAGSGGQGGSGGSGGTTPSCAESPVLEDGPFTGWTPSVPAALDAEIATATRPAYCGDEYEFVSTVRGWVTAPGGEPMRCALVQTCVYFFDGERNGYVCLSPAETDAEGVYTSTLPEDVRCIRSAAVRVILPASGRAAVYCPLATSDDGVVKVRDPVVVPYVTKAVDLPALGDPEAARKVRFDDGLELEVTPSLYLSNIGTYEDFGAIRVPVDAVGLCGERPGFAGLYAFYREGVVENPGYPLSIPNATGLAPGTRVELLVLGGLECAIDGTKVPEAEWAPFGEGTVSEDGSTITSDEGSGLPCFSWLGYREKT